MSEAYIGEIRLFAGSYAPQGWALCNGATLAISGNEALYALLGTTYGGDGLTNFALPDLQGRVALGVGQGPGLTQHLVGAKGGSETVALTATQIPTHAHALNASTATATDVTPGTNKMVANVGSNLFYLDTTTSGLTLVDDPFNAAALNANVNSGAPHANVQATMALNYIMCTAGTFPSFN